MPQGRYQYLSLLLFLMGVSLIVFLQFNSGKSVNKLIGGNRQLLSELQLNSHLQRLQTDVMTLESDIRGAVITHDSSYLQHVSESILGIRKQQELVDNAISDAYSENLLDELNGLLERKIAFSYQVLDFYMKDDIPGAEALINTNRGKLLRDSITSTAQELDLTRQKKLSAIITSIDDNSERAHSWGLIFGVVGCVLCIAVFWFMLVQSQRQNALIRELNSSQQALREATAVKEHFMSNMSHEIRTPLNSVLGYGQLLEKTELNQTQQQYLNSLRKAGQNLLVLVNDILDISKIEAGMLRIETIPFSPQSLMDEIERSFLPEAEKRGLVFRVNTAEGLPDLLQGDPVRVQQIVSNLLSNALKFTREGSVTLALKATEISDDRCRLCFVVTDTGIGIAPENRERIFNRFQQANDATSRQFGGTGLGLSIVKELSELLGGKIELDPAYSQGARFIVSLPFGLVGDSVVGLPDSFLPDTDKIDRKLRILVAEDNEMNRELFRQLLQSNGFTAFQIAPDGESALEFLKQRPFDILLTDLQLPGIDGIALIHKIRNELRLTLPVIAVTAGITEGKSRALESGMNDYLLKPFDERGLLQVIAKHTAMLANPPEGKLEIIDLAYLNRIASGNISFQKAMLEQFIRQVPEELLALRSAIDREDYPGIRSHSHTLKSSVAFLGLSRHLQSLLVRFEEIEPHGHNGQLMALFTQVEKTCLQAVAEAELLAEEK